MKKTIQKKKSTRALAVLILCSFLLLPITPVFAEENAAVVPAEEKPALENAVNIGEQERQKESNQNIKDVTISEVVDIVEENLENSLPESDGVLKKEKDKLVLKDSTPNDGDKVSLPISGTGKIEMTSSENGTTKIDLPDDGKTSNATIVNESTIVYANTAPGVDTVVTVPSDNNVETYHIIRSSESPKSYVYKVTIPQGGKLEQIDDRNIAVLNADGLPEMSISAPSAKDAQDKEVPLRLIIEENTVILYVDHNESLTYPVMADPIYKGFKMNDAEWNFCKKPWNWGVCDGAGNILAKNATKKAENVNKKFGWSLHNGWADAFRHCYWSGLMTMAYGSDVAKGFGDRHEEEPAPEKPKKPNTKDKKKIKKWEDQIREWEKKYDNWKGEKEMDLFNNEKGRSWQIQEMEFIQCALVV